MIHDKQSFGKSGCFIHNTISSNNNSAECILCNILWRAPPPHTQSWCLMQISHPYIYDELALYIVRVGRLVGCSLNTLRVCILYYYFRPLALTGRRRKFNSQPAELIHVCVCGCTRWRVCWEPRRAQCKIFKRTEALRKWNVALESNYFNQRCSCLGLNFDQHATHQVA